jgi:hypothetical protein
VRACLPILTVLVQNLDDCLEVGKGNALGVFDVVLPFDFFGLTKFATDVLNTPSVAAKVEELEAVVQVAADLLVSEQVIVMSPLTLHRTRRSEMSRFTSGCFANFGF